MVRTSITLYETVLQCCFLLQLDVEIFSAVDVVAVKGGLYERTHRSFALFALWPLSSSCIAPDFHLIPCTLVFAIRRSNVAATVQGSRIRLHIRDGS